MAVKKNQRAFSVWNRNRKLVAVFAVALFAGLGSFMVLFSGAAVPDEILLSDQPARGLVYDGKKIKNKGPCKGGFDVTSVEEEKNFGQAVRNCVHLDSGPEGIDIRERAKTIDQELKDLAKKDELKPPLKSNDPITENVAPEAISGANMSGLPGRTWPCIGDGKDGKRVHALYVYQAGKPNRINEYRAGFEAIAKRMNEIFMQSGHDSGNAQQIRFLTSAGAGCNLGITSVELPAEYMKGFTTYKYVNGQRVIDYSGIDRALARVGFDRTDRKYLVWADYRYEYAKCGQGSLYRDTKPTQDNDNNTKTGYAVTWNGCWNYGEPHELMHNLGGAQPGAPYATAGFHCRDDNDIMCYDDTEKQTLTIVKRCTGALNLWRYDCGKDTYYSGKNPTSGWLSKYWNTANNTFLTR